MSTDTETALDSKVRALTGQSWSVEIDDVPVSVSIAGELIAVGGAEGSTWLFDAVKGELRRTIPTLPGGLLHVALSPDGAHLAATGPFGYLLWHAADGQARVVETGSWCSTVRWAEANRLAVAVGRAAHVLDAHGEALWRTEETPSTVTDLAWHHDGRRLAVSAYGGVYCFERHQAAPVTTYPYAGSHLAIAIASTGRWITTGNQDATVHIWRARDADELTMSGYPEKVTRLAFDPTGRFLANNGAPDVSVWDFAGKGPNGTSPRILAGHEVPTAIAWRPGSQPLLASGGGEGILALWQPERGRPGRTQKPVRQWRLDNAVTDLAWIDAHHLLVTDDSGRVALIRI